MRTSFLIPAVAIAVIVMATVPMSDGADADTVIEGYIYTGTDLTKTNLKFTVVYSSDGSTGENRGETNTVTEVDNSIYRFSIVITDASYSNKYYLKFDIKGFSMCGFADTETEPTSISIDGNEHSCYRIEKFVNPKMTNTLGSQTDTFCANGAYGTIRGDVTIDADKPILLNGVKITLYDDDGKEVNYTYSENGSYSIKCAVGKYKVVFSLSNYDSVEKEVTVSKNSDSVVDVVMVSNESYFGLDLPHALMVIGGILGLGATVFAITYRIILMKRKSRLK